MVNIDAAAVTPRMAALPVMSIIYAVFKRSAAASAFAASAKVLDTSTAINGTFRFFEVCTRKNLCTACSGDLHSVFAEAFRLLL